MSKYMSKVINFPTHIRKQAIEDEMLEIDEEITEFVEECKEAAQTTLLMIEELLLNEYGETFDDLDFRDDSLSESRDMFVIMNMVTSMLMRYGGVEHFLSEDFETIYDKLMEPTE
jgi:hypothetical protein